MAYTVLHTETKNVVKEGVIQIQQWARMIVMQFNIFTMDICQSIVLCLLKYYFG